MSRYISFYSTLGLEESGIGRAEINRKPILLFNPPLILSSASNFAFYEIAHPSS